MYNTYLHRPALDRKRRKRNDCTNKEKSHQWAYLSTKSHQKTSERTLEILESMRLGETMNFEELAEKVSPNWRIAIKAFDNLANLGYLEISDGGKESFGVIKKIS
jgi:hypothetical protein